MAYCDEESFWVPGYGISRPVLTSNICFFLGPQAFVRPYTHEVGAEDCLFVSAAAWG